MPSPLNVPNPADTAEPASQQSPLYQTLQDSARLCACALPSLSSMSTLKLGTWLRPTEPRITTIARVVHFLCIKRPGTVRIPFPSSMKHSLTS